MAAADLDRNLKLIGTFWPLALTFIGVLIAGVRADARITEVQKKADYIYTSGSPPVVERLGRIEERQLVLIKSLERIEKKLDEEQKR